MSKLGRLKGKRYRRIRRRGKMRPAHATEVSKRTRSPWPRTKAITRYHPRPQQIEWDYSEDEDAA